MGRGFKWNLNHLREKAKLSPEKLSELLAEMGTPDTVENLIGYENGEGMPTVLVSKNMAKIFGVTLDYLYSEMKPRAKKPKVVRKKPKKREKTPLQLYFKRREMEQKKNRVM